MPVKPLQTVENAFGVLEAVADNQPVGVSALARSVGLDKAAVQRILVTLRSVGWLQQSVDGATWELSPQALVVGRRYAPGLRDRARPHLEVLQAATGETVVLWVRDGDRVVVLDSVESPQPLRMTVTVGHEVPLAKSGTFLACLPDDERRAIGGVSDRQAWAIRKRGWYVVRDEMYSGTCAVGAPIVEGAGTADGRLVGAITVVGPDVRMPSAVQRRYGPLVAGAAAQV